ncbi:hypothetical protein AAC387_Pa09g0336 [Persea americana]
MALSKNANLLTSMVNRIAFAITRRGFSGASSMMARKHGEEKKVVVMMREGGIESSSSWVPDPVTGFYKPANRVGEIDPAELREMLLNKKTVVSQE